MPERDGRPQTTKLLEDVLFDALQLPVADRSIYVDQAYPNHPDRRRELKKLLAIAENDPALLVAPDDPDLPPVLGNYLIIGQCGRGGMGFVYEARDQSLQRRVALKVLPDHLAFDTRVLANFEREARVLASLIHTNIAVLHSKERHDNIHFLTMEFVPGRTLDDILRDGPLPLATALDYLRQITRALAYAHAQGVVHLDLKPANIMVTAEGQIKLLDFGISRALQPAPAGLPEGFSPTDFTTPWGTPGYMSPEQLARGKVDFRTDFWALGCVLFEVLTGQRAGANPSRKTRDPIPGAVELPLKTLPPKTPTAVRALIRDCTQTDPNLRPGNISMVLSGLTTPPPNSLYDQLLRLTPLLLVIVLLGVFYSTFMRSSELMSVEILSENQLRGSDSSGQTIWTRNPPYDLVMGRIWATLLVVLGDESTLGVVATTLPGKDRAAIHFLDPKTGATRWSQDMDWEYPVNYSGPLRCRWVVQAHWPGFSDPVLIAGLRDGQWYAGGLLVLDLEQQELARYYHPGPLTYAGEVDDDNDGVPSYVLYGMNSSARFVKDLVSFTTDSHCASVLILDPNDISGQAFPYSEELPEVRDWPGMKKAQERAYTLIPPVLRNDDFDLTITGFTQEVGPSGATSFQVMLNDGRTFFLDSEMRPVRYYAVIDSPIKKLPGWPELPPARCLYIRNGKQEYIDVTRTD